jgi:NADPH:quinone reductase-like Zn-dependent oxidoreductase
MLAKRSNTQPGDTVLIQGAGGGVATAAIVLAKALGLNVWATSRDEDKRAFATGLGADQVFESNAKLPGKVDAVIETVGEATWSHSLRSLRPGGTVVVSGATSGAMPPADLNRVFFLQLSINGSTMGSRSDLVELLELMERTKTRPVIDRVLPIQEARIAFKKTSPHRCEGRPSDPRWIGRQDRRYGLRWQHRWTTSLAAKSRHSARRKCSPIDRRLHGHYDLRNPAGRIREINVLV